jgi:hypothetical protein
VGSILITEPPGPDKSSRRATEEATEDPSDSGGYVISNISSRGDSPASKEILP